MKMLRIIVLFSVAASPVGGQAARTIPVSVVTDFGGAQDDPAAEMLGVSGAVRTDDGRFVVVNGKPLEVRVYDQRGRLQRRMGRAGNGPGEFTRDAQVRYWSGDSVLTYSPATRRWMLFGLDGTVVREWPLGASEPRPDGVVIYGGAFALNGIGNSVHCHAAAIRRLAPAQGPLHEMMVDLGGRVWLRAADTERWRVHAGGDGRHIGTVALPRFLPTHWTPAGLLGYQSDADDFPHIVLIRPELPAADPSRGECPPSPAQSARSGEVRATLRNAMTAAEGYYADFGRYPRSMAEMGRRLELPAGIGGTFEPAPANSFAFSAWEVATGYRCLVSVGGAIRGAGDGTIDCGG